MQPTKCAAVVTYLVVLTSLRADPVFSTIHSFDGSIGATPKCTLMQASDGNIYGTAFAGGTNGAGSIYKVTLSGTVTRLYSFTGGNDGANPVAGLCQGSDGALYGTTFNGGTDDLGTIFKISTDGIFTNLFSFDGNDGSHPTGRLVQGPDGFFYGDTFDGGAPGQGTIFRFKEQGGLGTLYAFSGGDGANPYAGLLYGLDGNLYGVCSGGGPGAEGTIFFAGTTGGMSIIYPLGGGDEGGNPFGELFQTPDGNVFGTTYNGGSGYGTLFQLSPPGGLHLLGGIDGAHPRGGTLISNGILYGTTESGGLGYGTVLSVPLANPAVNTLHAFTNGLDGATPVSGLLLASDGNLWGVARDGGANQMGTIFRIYLAQPTPVFLTITPTNGGAALSWISVKDRTYQLQSCNDFASGWHNLGNVVTATGEATVITVDAGRGQNYYRVLSLQGPAPASELANVSFEVPSVGPTNQYFSLTYRPFNASWDFAGNAGIAVNGSGFQVFNSPTQAGVQFAFLSNTGGTGGSMEQKVALADGWYTLGFIAEQRDRVGRDNLTNQAIRLEIDSSPVETFIPPGTNWVTHTTVPFHVALGAHAIRLSSPDELHDGTAIIDDVSLLPSADTNGVVIP